MNRKRIQILRDHLAGLPDERFAMERWFSAATPNPFLPKEMTHECGTAACIAGWTLSLFRKASVEIWEVEHIAASILGLTIDQACDLFMPPGFVHNKQTRAQAVATLDRLLETGEVQW